MISKAAAEQGWRLTVRFFRVLFAAFVGWLATVLAVEASFYFLRLPQASAWLAERFEVVTAVLLAAWFASLWRWVK